MWGATLFIVPLPTIKAYLSSVSSILRGPITTWLALAIVPTPIATAQSPFTSQFSSPIAIPLPPAVTFDPPPIAIEYHWVEPIEALCPIAIPPCLLAVACVPIAIESGANALAL